MGFDKFLLLWSTVLASSFCLRSLFYITKIVKFYCFNDLNDFTNNLFNILQCLFKSYECRWEFMLFWYACNFLSQITENIGPLPFKPIKSFYYKNNWQTALYKVYCKWMHEFWPKSIGLIQYQHILVSWWTDAEKYSHMKW